MKTWVLSPLPRHSARGYAGCVRTAPDIPASTPMRAQGGFSLRRLGHHVEGTFHVQKGTIDFDPSAQKISGCDCCRGTQRRQWRAKPRQEDGRRRAGHPRTLPNNLQPERLSGTLAPKGDSTIQVSGLFTLPRHTT